jgi:hypothetical protein
MRHAKIFYITEESLLALFVARSHDCTLLPILKDVPGDVSVTKVWWEPDCDRFAFRLEHPTFPEVPTWEYPPPCEVEEQLIKKDEVFKEKLANRSLRELLAIYAHDAWSGWMKYLFAQGHFRADNGSFVISQESVERWTRQMTTRYENLSEAEKDSDRNEADRILSLIRINII